jgi:hypothetical protein
MKTITISKVGHHYTANVYGIRGQQSQEPDTIVFNSDFLKVNEKPDYTSSKKQICVIAGVNWINNADHIGELIKIAVHNDVNGYTTRGRLLNKKFGAILPPVDMLGQLS